MSDFVPVTPGVSLQERAPEPATTETNEIWWAHAIHEFIVWSREFYSRWNHLIDTTPMPHYQQIPTPWEPMETVMTNEDKPSGPPQGFIPPGAAPAEETVHPGLWELACEGQLPPDMAQDMFHLSLEYYATKDNQFWHCRHCHKAGNYPANDYVYIETHSVIHLSNLQSPWVPECYCGTNIARAISVDRCTSCQKMVLLHGPRLRTPGQCLTVAPRTITIPGQP